jgi:hypothetical protein
MDTATPCRYTFKTSNKHTTQHIKIHIFLILPYHHRQCTCFFTPNSHKPTYPHPPTIVTPANNCHPCEQLSPLRRQGSIFRPNPPLSFPRKWDTKRSEEPRQRIHLFHCPGNARHLFCLCSSVFVLLAHADFCMSLRAQHGNLSLYRRRLAGNMPYKQPLHSIWPIVLSFVPASHTNC